MDARVTEFHCIMPLENIPSVLEHGILSYERAAKLQHRSVALPEVQDKRDTKQVPGGLKLHQYANLYFHARNPMMYKRQNEAAKLCVLRVATVVSELEGVVFADRNAAGGDNWVLFLPPRKWALLDFDRIYARDWRDMDRFAYYDKKRKKCAEVLVPHRVDLQFLIGAYVLDKAAADGLHALGFSLSISIDPDFSFIKPSNVQSAQFGWASRIFIAT
jgi:hypothetical protein